MDKYSMRMETRRTTAENQRGENPSPPTWWQFTRREYGLGWFQLLYRYARPVYNWLCPPDGPRWLGKKHKQD